MCLYHMTWAQALLLNGGPDTAANGRFGLLPTDIMLVATVTSFAINGAFGQDTVCAIL